MTPDIKDFHHEQSGTFSYVVSDPKTRRAAVIDPVLGYCAMSGRTDRRMAEAVIEHVRECGLEIEWILETHAHADHLSAAQYLQAELGGRVAIGEGIRDVQAHFGTIFNLKAPFVPDGHQFDHLFFDGDEFLLGEIVGRVMHTPGHTCDSVSYVFGGAAFVGDTLFMTDVGTARCDFPGGDAAVLFNSIQRILSLPDETELYLCHDYPPTDRALCCKISVAEQKTKNIHIGNNVSRAQFVSTRTERDASLSLPALILPSIQVNIQAGTLPRNEDNDIRYIKIPLDTL
jgi:glyoxylase-like metal-dependent hydrolase (beta-lactamase superfamily II)